MEGKLLQTYRLVKYAREIGYSQRPLCRAIFVAKLRWRSRIHRPEDGAPPNDGVNYSTLNSACPRGSAAPTSLADGGRSRRFFRLAIPPHHAFSSANVTPVTAT